MGAGSGRATLVIETGSISGGRSVLIAKVSYQPLAAEMITSDALYSAIRAEWVVAARNPCTRLWGEERIISMAGGTRT